MYTISSTHDHSVACHLSIKHIIHALMYVVKQMSIRLVDYVSAGSPPDNSSKVIKQGLSTGIHVCECRTTPGNYYDRH